MKNRVGLKQEREIQRITKDLLRQFNFGIAFGEDDEELHLHNQMIFSNLIRTVMETEWVSEVKFRGYSAAKIVVKTQPYIRISYEPVSALSMIKGL